MSEFTKNSLIVLAINILIALICVVSLSLATHNTISIFLFVEGPLISPALGMAYLLGKLGISDSPYLFVLLVFAAQFAFYYWLVHWLLSRKVG